MAHDMPQPPASWATIAAWLVPLCALPSALWRVTLFFEGDRHTPSEQVYFVVLSAVQLVLALLTLGLVQRWGEIWPRWIPVLRGRPVPARRVAVIAIVGAAALIALCVYAVLNDIFDLVDRGPVLIGPDRGGPEPDSSVVSLYVPMLAWGPLLLAVALHYRRRHA